MISKRAHYKNHAVARFFVFLAHNVEDNVTCSLFKLVMCALDGNNTQWR